MSREDEIKARLEALESMANRLVDAQSWFEAVTAVSANAPSDLRYLLDKVERLEGELATPTPLSEIDSIGVGETRVVRIPITNRGRAVPPVLSDYEYEF